MDSRIVGLFWIAPASIEARQLRSSVLALVGVVSLLGGCATKSLETEKRCSQAAPNGECPVGTTARTESDYRKDVDAIDDLRCRALANDSIDAYRRCLARYEKDRR